MRTMVISTLFALMLVAPAPVPLHANGGGAPSQKATGHDEKASTAQKVTQLPPLKVKDLPEKYQKWLEDVSLLITKEEKEAFLKLRQNYQRDSFIEHFWKVRDPYPDTPQNELKDRWYARLSEAREEFGTLHDERSKFLLLNGEPLERLKARCSEVLWPLEIWYYQGTDRYSRGMYLIFYQPFGVGHYRLWMPTDPLSELADQNMPANSTSGSIVQAIQESCFHSQEIMRALGFVSGYGDFDYARLVHKLETPPSEARSGEWVSTFNTYSTDVPPSAKTFDAKLSFDFPGRHQSRTIVQGMVAVAKKTAGVSDLAGHRSYNFLLNGQVLVKGKLFDAFRYKFNLPADKVDEGTIPLVFERYLRPNTYRLVLMVKDLNAESYFHVDRSLQVPDLQKQGPPPPADATTARLLAEANAAISSGEDTIKIIPPQGQFQTGLVRFDTLTTGKDIDHVTFVLDGKPVLTKNQPPYSVELSLGNLPRLHTIEAVAYDSDGKELARDHLDLNAASQRFSIRLVEPRPGKHYIGSLRAQAKVTVPDGESIARVEFYLNETLVATLYQPPYVQPIVLPENSNLTYVRAVAYEPDGNRTEDVVFVNAPDVTAAIKIHYVELYITVLDRDNHPIKGLKKSDFSVSEDGVPQKPLRFNTVDNLPIRVAVMVDTSASMKESLPMAQKAALSFFKQAIHPKDRAALITFNDHPNLAVKFTNSLDQLAGGLAGLVAERGTALYDSLIFTLYYFNGVKGQRAIILLTDGKDEGSRFSYDDALDYARRAGVAIYTIGLGFHHGERDVRKKLERLADETGGRAFLVSKAEELPHIYDTIQEELRSRYYLTYQSTNSSDSDAFRTIEVKVDRRGAQVKTLRGYYP